jgi:putative flippase GtrA
MLSIFFSQKDLKNEVNPVIIKGVSFFERNVIMEKLIKMCVSILPKPLQDIYYKYEDKWLYVLFGGLTTVVSIVTKFLAFAVIPGEPKWESTAGVVFSWICAVTFAFFTNKKYVFKNETKTAKEFWTVFFSFYGSRLATLGMEEAIFLICCDWLGVSKSIITIASQFIIFIANYILSKVFVFRKKKEETNG